MDAWVELKSVELLLPMLVRSSEGARRRCRVARREGWIGPPSGLLTSTWSSWCMRCFLRICVRLLSLTAAEAESIADSAVKWHCGPRLGVISRYVRLPLVRGGVGDRDFDLLFGPLAVQSRFSDGDFRRIGAHGIAARVQKFHRLAAPTAARIFRSEEPSLVTPNVVGLFNEHELSNRGGVRIAPALGGTRVEG